MNTEKTGGAAFPKLKDSYGNAQGSVTYQSSNGMTLLDYFAAKAMQGEISGREGEVPSEKYMQGNIAIYCYELAAAMLTERQKYI